MYVEIYHGSALFLLFVLHFINLLSTTMFTSSPNKLGSGDVYFLKCFVCFFQTSAINFVVSSYFNTFRLITVNYHYVEIYYASDVFACLSSAYAMF